ncbi:MAG: hypothetical protein Q8L11_03020 [Candidatus Moranbacteria bacterium]|nr:hypothetical protein [Candidatus Moranbacteria bacterium]
MSGQEACSKKNDAGVQSHEQHEENGRSKVQSYPTAVLDSCGKPTGRIVQVVPGVNDADF